MQALDFNPYMQLAGDLDSILEDEEPEIVIESLSLLLGKYILECDYPRISAIHAQKILINSLNFNKQGK